MKQGLVELKDYGVFTFISTSHALKAERVLKNDSAEFLMIPTPRQISTSCGLAVKVREADLDSARHFLLNNQVKIEGIYQVQNIAGQTKTKRIYNE